MKSRLFLVVFLCLLLVFSLACSKAPKEVKAWVLYKHPDAKIIQEVGSGYDITYMLCEKNKLLLISTTSIGQGQSSNDAITNTKEIVLPSTCTCEAIEGVNPPTTWPPQ